MTTMTGKFPDPRPMTERKIEKAARSDPDTQPLTEEDFRRMRKVPRVKIIRRALRLTQEEFARAIGFRSAPCGIRGRAAKRVDGRTEPDQPARATFDQFI